MKRATRTIAAWLFGVLGLLLAAPNAIAVATDATLDFNGNGGGGSLSYAGFGQALLGSNIGIDYMVATDTPTNAGLFLCDTCELNFQTGLLNGTIDVGGTTTYIWNSGGSFEITGTVTDLGGTAVASGTLLSGTFSGGVNFNTGDVEFSSTGLDAKHPDLLAHFNVAAAVWSFGNLTIGGDNLVVNSDGSFDVSVTRALVTNFDPQVQPVPEPSTLALMGIGLAGAGLFGRRSRKT